MTDLPPEDRPDEIWIGPIGPIPIIDEDDPRFVEERALSQQRTGRPRRSTRRMSSSRESETKTGVCAMNPSIASSLDGANTHAPSTPSSNWQVLIRLGRFAARAMMRLDEFDLERVEPTLQGGLDDRHEDVRWSARFILFQLGLIDEPPPGLD